MQKFNSTVARMAGNIAAGMVGHGREYSNSQGRYLGTHAYEAIAYDAVILARMIVAQVIDTELPTADPASVAVDSTIVALQAQKQAMINALTYIASGEHADEVKGIAISTLDLVRGWL